MPGLRLSHPTERNVRVIVPHPGGTVLVRNPKDIHLNVDSEGFTIVSTGVWATLEECEGFGYVHGFKFVNEVANPPTQGVGFAPPGRNDVPDVKRLGHTRDSSPSFIEKMKREGIIPKGIQPSITEHVIPAENADPQE